jgi:hypothetical protein
MAVRGATLGAAGLNDHLGRLGPPGLILESGIQRGVRRARYLLRLRQCSGWPEADVFS